MQSIYIAEKRKEKAKWFILEKLREKNLQKIYFRRDIQISKKAIFLRRYQLSTQMGHLIGKYLDFSIFIDKKLY